MATFECDLSGMAKDFSRIANSSTADLKKAVDAGGEKAKVYVRQASEKLAHNHDADHVRGTTASHVQLKKAKKKGDEIAAYVTFNGTRSDGWFGTTRRVAEVAFINEYGALGKKLPRSGKPVPYPARHFIRDIIDSHEEDIVRAIEDALPEL